MITAVDFSLAATAAYDRLPGVTFLPHQPEARFPLPRLDVAGFVGFARRGPLNLPVPVEDWPAFKAIFGEDLPLAQDESGRIVHANLPQAVQAFFANGGRRCVVVRIAGRQAEAARLRLPGVIALHGRTGPRLAAVSASSPGRWGADLRIGARLAVTPLPASQFVWIDAGEIPGDDRPLGALEVNADRLRQMGTPSPQVGDILQLTLEDESRWLAPVMTANTPSSLVTQVGLSQHYQVVDHLVASPPVSMSRLDLLTIDGPTPLSVVGDPILEGAQTLIPLSEADKELLSAGDILRLEIPSGGSPPDDLVYLTRILDIQATGDTSPPSPPFLAILSPLVLISPEDQQPPPAVSPPVDGQPFLSLKTIELLRLDMLVTLEQDRLPFISNLAFNSPHHRFWGDAVVLMSTTLSNSSSSSSRSLNGQNGLIPFSSNTSFADSASWMRELDKDPYDLIPLPGERAPSQEIFEATFNQATALASLIAPVGSHLGVSTSEAQSTGYETADEETGLSFLPVGLPEIINESDPAQLRSPELDRRGDDDLDEFDASLFWDRYLAPSDETHRTLLSTAFDLHYLRGRRLRGMHAMLFVDELAVLTAPDAAHRPWESLDSEPSPEPLQPEAPEPDAACPEPADFWVCDRPPVVREVTPHFGPLDLETQVTIRGEGFAGDLEVFFGLRPAEAVEVQSSSQLLTTAPPGVRPGAVDVTVQNDFGQGVFPGGFIYENESTRPLLPTIIPRGINDRVADEPFLAIQQALLAFCQARADATVLLSVPQDYDLTRCLEWQHALRSLLGLPVLGEGFAFDELEEIADLSYAAVYHPWLLVADADAADRVRPVPPDGAIAGLIAARERKRQAWIAPANEPLQEVLGLLTHLSDVEWAVMFARRFNLVRPEAGDFRPMSAHTLSGERRLHQLSVRRLLILLRKALERWGMDFVFRANNEIFRQGVRVLLEERLRFLFERGAFAGRSEAESFRVTVDGTVNTPQTIDLGRFVAVVEIAPSQPMEFITVRLTRGGEGEIVAVEA